MTRLWKRAPVQLALWIPLSLALAVSGQAQQPGILVGRVTDKANAQPIVDARVLIAGTAIATRTNEDGRFRLSNVSPGSVTLRVVRLGYAAESRLLTIAEGGNSPADFSLSPVALTMDQMVVTATGETERRRESGISVGAIDTSQLNPASVANLSTVLAARAPGVTVLSSTGSSGMGSRVRVRGSNSINLSNDPLLIVDGVRVNNATNSFGVNLAGQTTSRFDDLNTEDIESIEVIKGPAASALYGTAAASGVVQVSTKRGRSGRTRWNSFAEYGLLNDVTLYPDNWSQVGLTPTNVRVNRCTIENVAVGACTAKVDSIFHYTPLENPEVSPFRQGFRNKYGLNAAGGAENATYYVAGEFQREQGIFDPNVLKHVNLRANLHAQLRSNLDATITSGYLSSRSGLTFNDNSAFGPMGAGLNGKAFDCRPSTYASIPACASAGDSLSRGYFNSNVTAQSLTVQQIESNVDHFTTGLGTNWQPRSWLRALGQGGLDIVQQNDTRFIPPGVLPQLGTQWAQGYRYAQRRTLPTYTLLGTLTASRQLRDGLESATSFSGQYVREEFHALSAQGQQILPGTESLNGASSLFAVGEANQQVVTLGIFGQEKLAWRDRLFLTASLRGDQGSTFGADAGYIYYPAASLSWVVSDESFFPQVSWLNQLRVRSAYGQSGQRPGFRQAQSFFNPVAVKLNNAEQSGITLGGTGNDGLRAERSAEWESGFESNLFGGRMGVELTYYSKMTSDALVRQVLAPSLGATIDRYGNLGKVKNSGFEALLNADVFDVGAVKLSTTVTYAANGNKLVALGRDVPPIVFTPQVHRAGYPLGAFFARKIKSYSDANGDGVISRVNCPSYGSVANPQIAGGAACEIVLADSESYAGSPLPTREASFTGTLTLYRNLRVTTLFDYRGGYKQFNATAEFRCNTIQNCREINDKSAPLEAQARAIASRMGTYGGYIEDGSFVKFRELAVTLAAPRRYAARIGADALSLTVAGRNLYTWTRYGGFDPEVNSGTSSAAFGSFGQIDFLTQPPVRTIVTRLSLNF